MCEPVSWTAVTVAAIGAVVSAGTAYAANQAQTAGANAQDRMQAAAIEDNTRRKQDLINQETANQENLRTGQTQAVNQQIDSKAPDAQAADLAAKEAARKNVYKIDLDPSKQYLPGQSDAPAIIRNAIDSKVGDTLNQVSGWNDNKAKLDAWSDLGVSNAIGDSRTGSTVGQIGGFRRAGLGLLDTSTDAIDASLTARQMAAARAGRAQRSLGDLLAGGSAVSAVGAGKAASRIDWTNPNSTYTNNQQGGLF